MKNEFNEEYTLTDYTGCFGQFRKTDIICKKKCAISLKCAIEHDQNIRMRLLEDLVSTEGVLVTMQ